MIFPKLPICLHNVRDWKTVMRALPIFLSFPIVFPKLLICLWKYKVLTTSDTYSPIIFSKLLICLQQGKRLESSNMCSSYFPSPLFSSQSCLFVYSNVRDWKLSIHAPIVSPSYYFSKVAYLST
jgi:hypothetical protein